VHCRSEHEANTERLITKSSSMRHIEGGWPRDVDFTEQTDTNRFRKKAEKVCGVISILSLKRVHTIYTATSNCLFRTRIIKGR